jgi:hypothetical protein
MKKWVVLFCLLSYARSYADSAESIIPSGMEAPKNQKLEAIAYFSDGRQSGCGLRATGDASDGLWLNVLVTAFYKGTGATFGVLKVVARKVEMKNGTPVLKDGERTFVEDGRISKAWIESASGKQPIIYKNGESLHRDAYMINTEFTSTMDVLVAMSHERFKVGVNRNGFGPDQIFEFDQRLEKADDAKFSACIKNLNGVIEENRLRESF